MKLSGIIFFFVSSLILISIPLIFAVYIIYVQGYLSTSPSVFYQWIIGIGMFGFGIWFLIISLTTDINTEKEKITEIDEYMRDSEKK